MIFKENETQTFRKYTYLKKRFSRRNSKLQSIASLLKNNHYVKSVFQILKERQNASKEAEIYQGLGQIRNLAIVYKGKPMTADYILEQLINHSVSMRGYYIKFLSLLRLNRKEEAVETFVHQIDMPAAANMARLLVRLDEIDPARLEETIAMYQRSIREERVTKHKERDEIISELLYFPVIMNVLLIFMNFMIIGYFLQQKEFLKMFLG